MAAAAKSRRSELKRLAGRIELLRLALQDGPGGPLEAIVPFENEGEAKDSLADSLSRHVMITREPLMVPSDLPRAAGAAFVREPVNLRLKCRAGVPLNFFPTEPWAFSRSAIWRARERRDEQRPIRPSQVMLPARSQRHRKRATLPARAGAMPAIRDAERTSVEKRTPCSIRRSVPPRRSGRCATPSGMTWRGSKL